MQQREVESLINLNGAVVFGKKDCYNCKIAVKMLDKKGVDYTYKDLSEDVNEPLLTYVKNEGIRSFPMLFFNSDYLGDHMATDKLISLAKTQ